MDASTTPLDVGSIAVGLLGGLALFLYGMDKLTDALKDVAGAGMRKLLARLTGNRFLGALTGAFVTAVLLSIELALSPFAEEPWLRERFGEAYRDYAARVPRFLGAIA